jgi:ribose-phosphate pyrophosphokinase
MKKIIVLLIFALTGFSSGQSYLSKHVAFSCDKNFKDQGHGDCVIFTGNSNIKLANAVAEKLGNSLGEARVARFNDGEVDIQLQNSIRGNDIFIIQSTYTSSKYSINDHLMELYLMIRACKRACAGSITAVIPYFGYARQDRKTASRVPISASDIAIFLENSGIDHIISVDLHCGQLQGFFKNTTVDEIYALNIFAPYIASKKLTNPVIISPDAGGVDRAKKFVNALTFHDVYTNLAIIVKHRKKAGEVEMMNLVGSVEGSDVIIIDDICDTAGTLCYAAKELKAKGAKRVFACITHPLFSGPALKRIKDSDIDELIVSDTIAMEKEYPPNIKQLSIAPIIAETIRRTGNGESLTSMFLE